MPKPGTSNYQLTRFQKLLFGGTIVTLLSGIAYILFLAVINEPRVGQWPCTRSHSEYEVSKHDISIKRVEVCDERQEPPMRWW